MADSNSTQSTMKQVSIVYLVEKSPSEVMVTLVFSCRGRRGRRRQWCSSSVEKDEAIGVLGMASGVEEEDGAMATDGRSGGGGALSAWRKTTLSVVEEEDGATATDGGMGGGGALSASRKTTARAWLGQQ